MLPLFLDTSVLECSKETTQNPENTTMQEMRLTSCTVLLPDWSFLFLPLLHFVKSLCVRKDNKLQCHGPEGEKSREQNVNSSTADKHVVLLCKLPRLAYLIYFLPTFSLKLNSLEQEGFVFMPCKQCFSTLSQLLHMIGLRSSAYLHTVILQWNKAALSRRAENSPKHPDRWEQIRVFLLQTVDPNLHILRIYFGILPKTLKAAVYCASCQCMELPTKVLRPSDF